jgi:hypothetical protein
MTRLKHSKIRVLAASTLEIIQMRSHGIPCDFHTPSVKTYMGLKKIRVRFRLNFVCKCLSDRTG